MLLKKISFKLVDGSYLKWEEFHLLQTMFNFMDVHIILKK